MTTKIILFIAAFVIILSGGATNSFAQVKRVEMHIGGYLCGN